jgi:hypothetical protein
MSTRIGSLYHPANQEPVDIYKGFSWPCLFLGPIWFIAKGLWLWAILSAILAVITMGFSQLVFPFFANGLFVKKMRKQGYLYEEQIKGNQSAQAATSAVMNMSLGIASQGIQPPSPPRNFYISRNGENLGPFSEVEIREQLSSGACTAEDHAWHEGETDWKPLGHLLVPVTTTAVPSASARSPKSGVSLVFAKLDDGISWKNEYDIYDANTGQMFSQIREGEVGGLTKVARMGQASVNSKFDVMFSSLSGTPQFRCRNKGLTGSTCEVLSPDGATLGEVKADMGLQMKSTLTETGGANVYKTKGNGVGVMCTKHDITKNGGSIGKIADINESEARTILGSNFGVISASRKYDFAYHLALDSSQENLPLILSSVYRIAHTSGRS